MSNGDDNDDAEDAEDAEDKDEDTLIEHKHTETRDTDRRQTVLCTVVQWFEKRKREERLLH